MGAKHLANLPDVFSPFRTANLKYNFLQTEGKYLGHMISPERIQTNPGNKNIVKTVTDDIRFFDCVRTTGDLLKDLVKYPDHYIG